MTIRLTPAQGAALARLIRSELAACAEADCPLSDAALFERSVELVTGDDLDAIAPLLALLEASGEPERGLSAQNPCSESD